MSNLTRKGGKSFHPRHATQSAAAADRQERAVEKQERQAAAKEVEREAQLLAEAEALEKQYAEADAFDFANMPVGPDEEVDYNEYLELHEAGLNRGQP